MSSDLPHVTDVLKSAKLVDDRWYTPEARERGSAVHLACELVDAGSLDRSSLDPTIVGKVGQYEKFLAECRPEIVYTEKFFESQALGYCGTPDRVLIINGMFGVLDIKPAEEDWHGVQLAAYRHLVDGHTRGRDRWAAAHIKARASGVHAWNLYLTPKGYSLVPRTDRRDWQIFQSALQIHNWKESRGKAHHRTAGA